MELLFDRSVTLEKMDDKGKLNRLTLYMKEGSPEILFSLFIDDEYLGHTTEAILSSTYDRQILTHTILAKWEQGYNLKTMGGKAVDCFLGKDMVDQICAYFLPDQTLPDINWTNTSLVCPVW